VYPWIDASQCSREPAIDDPETIPTLLSNMKKYAYRMPIWQKGGLVYPQVFLDSWTLQTKSWKTLDGDFN